MCRWDITGHKIMKEKKLEELQTRRGFFKQAARTALPVLSAVMLAQLPIQKTFAATDCNGSCSGTCTGSCYESCSGSCTGSCSGSCNSTTTM